MMITRKIAHKAETARASARKTAGRVTGNRRRQAKGRRKQARGSLRLALAKIRGAFGR
jgi:uncharacterized protein YjbJ (UPF0337 family)